MPSPRFGVVAGDSHRWCLQTDRPSKLSVLCTILGETILENFSIQTCRCCGSFGAPLGGDFESVFQRISARYHACDCLSVMSRKETFRCGEGRLGSSREFLLLENSSAVWQNTGISLWYVSMGDIGQKNVHGRNKCIPTLLSVPEREFHGGKRRFIHAGNPKHQSWGQFFFYVRVEFFLCFLSFYYKMFCCVYRRPHWSKLWWSMTRRWRLTHPQNQIFSPRISTNGFFLRMSKVSWKKLARKLWLHVKSKEICKQARLRSRKQSERYWRPRKKSPAKARPWGMNHGGVS